MHVSHPRALVISLAAGIGVGIVGGTIYSLVGDRPWIYGVGAVLFFIGVTAFSLGMLGAVEPKDGWATTNAQKRRRELRERRSMASSVMRSRPELHESSGWQLAVWALVVGVPLILLSLVCFTLAA